MSRIWSHFIRAPDGLRDFTVAEEIVVVLPHSNVSSLSFMGLDSEVSAMAY